MAAALDLSVSAWHLREPERLTDLKQRVVERFPTLRFVIDENGRVVVTGTYALVEGKTPIEDFRVSIVLPDNFPRALPAVYELDGKIPPLSRFHRNAGDGTLCVVLPDEYWLSRDECDLVEFLEGPLHNYFLGLVHYKEFDEWPFGEHDHGGDGVFAFYSALFKTSDRDAVTGFLELLAHDELKPFPKCPCGSGIQVRDCHWTQATELHRIIRPSLAAAALERLSR